MEKIDFIQEVSLKKAMKFLDEIEKRKIETGLITEWGAVIPDNAKFIVELGDENNKNYIATKGFLQKSKDEVFVRLKKDNKEIEMPDFDDVFELKEFNLEEEKKGEHERY